MLFFIMFNDFRLTEKPLHNGESVIVCQMCCKYAKTKSEIMNSYKKKNILLPFFLNSKL